MIAPHDADVAARLERLRSDLAAQAAKIRRGSSLAMIAGVIALGALGVYFYLGYSMFSEALQHDRVADAVATIADDNAPVVRKALEAEARRSAPDWAEGLSRQLRDSLPLGRRKLEDYVMERTDETLRQGTVLTAEQFTKFLQDNKAALQVDMAELSKGPTLADGALADLEKALQAQLDSDLRNDAGDLVAILTAFTEKLDKLSKNQGLDQTENLERRLAMIIRRVQSEKVASSDSASKSLPTSISAPARPRDSDDPKSAAPSAPVPASPKDAPKPS